MFNVFFYEGDLTNDIKREDLLWQATEHYCMQNEIPYDMMNINLRRTEKGKPYFENLPVHFSIAHSGMMWMCIMGDIPCGIDLQQFGDYDYMRIAQRHFKTEEQKYISMFGEKAFYKIWSRREALGKYTGEGFYGEKPSFIDETGQLADKVTVNDKMIYLKDIPMGEGVVCVYCSEEEKDEIKFFGR